MTFQASLDPEFLYSWESQVSQYPLNGVPGIEYFPGPTPYGTVDCLLFRDVHGKVVGILNHYGFDSPYESTGNVNIWVHPHRQRRGIGTALIKAATGLWPINLDQQRFTPSGMAFAEKLRADGTL